MMRKFFRIFIDLLILAAVIWLGFFGYRYFLFVGWFYIGVTTLMLSEFIAFVRRANRKVLKANKNLVLYWLALLSGTVLWTIFLPGRPWLPGFAFTLIALSACTRISGKIVGKTWHWEKLEPRQRNIIQLLSVLLVFGIALLSECMFNKCMLLHPMFIVFLAGGVLSFTTGVIGFYGLKKRLGVDRFGLISQKVDGLFDRFGHTIYLFWFIEIFSILYKILRAF